MLWSICKCSKFDPKIFFSSLLQIFILEYRFVLQLGSSVGPMPLYIPSILERINLNMTTCRKERKEEEEEEGRGRGGGGGGRGGGGGGEGKK